MTKNELNKFIKTRINSQPIIIRWQNFLSWETRPYKTLEDVIKDLNISFKQEGDKLFIKLNAGTLDLKLETTLYDLELNTIKIIKMFYIYMGDRVKMKTRFGTVNINF